MSCLNNSFISTGKESGDLEDTDQRSQQPKYSRLNLVSKLERCNSLSGGTSKKRKVLDTSIRDSAIDQEPYRKKECPEYFTIKEATNNLSTLMADFDKLIKELYNPPNKLKDWGVRLKRTINMVNRDIVQNWLEKNRWELVEKATYDVDTQTDSSLSKDTTIASVCDRCAKEISQDKKIKEFLSKPEEDWSCFDELKSMSWPEAVYVKTKQGSNWRTPPTASELSMQDTVIIVDGDLSKDAVVAAYSQTNPDLQIVFEKNLITAGKLICTEATSRLSGDLDIEQYTSSHLTYLVGGGENIRSTLLKIKESLSNKKHKSVLRIVQTNVAYLHLRKTVEYIFRDTKNLEQIIITPARGTHHDTGTLTTALPTPTTETVEITLRDCTAYSDAVRQMKKKVDPNKFGVRVLASRQTKDGKIQLRIDTKKVTDRAVISNFVQELQGAENNIQQVNVRRPTRDLLIKDIKPEDKEEDIKEALLEVASSMVPEELSLYLAPPREKGMRYAVATIPVEHADNILQRKRLRIGWDRCRVEEKLTLDRCYNCQQYDHTANRCPEKGQKVPPKCRNCGQQGHMIVDCKASTPSCYSCGAEGHKAGTMACPTYRGLIQALRKRKQQQTPPAPPNVVENMQSPFPETVNRL